MFEKTTLDNGLRLVSAHMPSTPSVSICLFIGTGSRYERDSEAGISHFIEHLLFRGTPKRSTAKEISEAIESVGGIINAGTDKELTVYWCKVAKPHYLLAFDILSDILLNSQFNLPDIEKERQIIIEEIRRSKDSPSQRVNLLIEEILWPRHPLGNDIAGSQETVSRISQGDILEYLNRQYQPHNAVVTIAGNLTHNELIPIANNFFDSWSAQGSTTRYLDWNERQSRRFSLSHRETEQVHLCLALPGLSLNHPKRFVLDLLNVILGEGMSSRLFVNIRDQLGLAYSINSYVEHFLDAGAMIIYAGVDPKRVTTALKAIKEQLFLLTKPIPETEINKAKELSKGRLLMRMENSRNVAGWIGGQEILLGQILGIEEVINIIDNIHAEEVSKLSQELVAMDQLHLAIVGPITNEESLEGLMKS